MVSESMRQLGAQGNPMRVLFEYGKKRAAVIGAENVLDFALGNPSAPPPQRVNGVVMEVLSGERKDSMRPVKLIQQSLSMTNDIESNHFKLSS